MGGGQDGCERRIKVFVKIKGGGGRVGGGGLGEVRVDVNREVKFLRKLKKKLWGGGRFRGGDSGWGGQGGCK